MRAKGCAMETHTDEVTQPQTGSPSQDLANGSIRRTPTGGPTTSEGAQYLEDLRALRHAQPTGGPRIFNPDETPAEAKERIRHALDGLDALRMSAEGATDEDGATWDDIIRSVNASRS